MFHLYARSGTVQLSSYVVDFVELSVTNAHIDQEIASAIVSNLATMKRLVLDKANLEKFNLELILRGCKELELLYVRDCVGFDDDDEEILMIASRIKDFRCEGSKIVPGNSDHFGDEYDHDYSQNVWTCDYYVEKYGDYGDCYYEGDY